MVLNTLKLLHFKNYTEKTFEFVDHINCIVGRNGVGKTNLLDAIYYLAMTRSALNPIDQQNILYDHPFMSVVGKFEDGALQVSLYLEQGKKKIYKVNGLELEKLSGHIGKIPLVFTSPDDVDLIKEGSETRRKLFDSVICQYDPAYLQDLILMQRLLKQRNTLLKQEDLRRPANNQLLDVYDEKLIPVFKRVAGQRTRFITEFVPYFRTNYESIFKGSEEVDIKYESECPEEDFEQIYRQSREKDLVLQRTNCGAHKDDYVFQLNDRPAKKFASQGQQKSFILALKLAEYDFLQSIKNTSPILLLDDIFDKLDDERIEHLVTLLSDPNRFSQVYITDARPERSQGLFKGKDVRFFEIDGAQR